MHGRSSTIASTSLTSITKSIRHPDCSNCKQCVYTLTIPCLPISYPIPKACFERTAHFILLLASAIFIFTRPIPVKLDQKQHQFQVEWVMGRDLVPSTLEDLLGCLKDWCGVVLSIFHFILTGCLVPQANRCASDTIRSHYTICQSLHPTQAVGLENHSVIQQKKSYIVRASRILQSRASGTGAVATL